MSIHREYGAEYGQTVKNRLSVGAIDVSINSTCYQQGCVSDQTYAEWTMRLQRWSGSSWTTIDSRSGYVSQTSPSHRTFTNISNHGTIRVVTSFTASIYHGYFSLSDHVRSA